MILSIINCIARMIYCYSARATFLERKILSVFVCVGLWPLIILSHDAIASSLILITTSVTSSSSSRPWRKRFKAVSIAFNI